MKIAKWLCDWIRGELQDAAQDLVDIKEVRKILQDPNEWVDSNETT